MRQAQAAFARASTLLVILAAALAGCASPAPEATPAADTAPAEAPASAPADAPATAQPSGGAPEGAQAAPQAPTTVSVPFTFEGLTPRGAWACSAPGCYGDALVQTEWQTPLPGEDAVKGLHLVLTWESVDATMGPLVFALSKVADDGAATFITTLIAETSPAELHVDDLGLLAGESGLVAVWPEAKYRGAPGAVFVDVSEQPFLIEGSLVTLAPSA